MALTGKQVAVDDEVLVPSLTFVATANAITYANAIPHFVDSEFSNYGVDPYALDQHLNRIATRKSDGSVINRESGRKIVGLIVVHIFGLPAQTVLLREVLERWGLWLIEDCAEALGSYHFERHVGHDGTISTLSFNGNKIITTGGGGAVLSNDVEMIAKLRHMATTAKVSDSVRFRHDMVGYNYRLPNLNAALGLSQLSKFQRLLGLKRQLATNFALSFKDSEWVEFVSEPKNTKSNYWLCSLRLRGPASQLNVDDIIELLNRRGIQARPCWDLMSTLPMYQDMPKATLTTAQKIRASTICLPSSPKLVLTMDLSQ
jgi:perosamine synthetase